MATVESNVAALELEKVQPKVRVVFERDAKFYNTIEKKDVEKISNRQMRIPLELRPGGSFQYFNPDGGDLGRGGGPQYDKAVVNCVFMSENIEYTKLAQWATDDERKSVTNAIRRNVASALIEFKRQLDSQSMQSGNGVVGTLSVVATSAGVDTYTLGTDGFGARLVRYGQTIQVFDATLATNRGSGVITMWDVENKQIAVTPAIAGATAGDLLVVNGISSPTSLPGLFGIPYHHSSASTGTWLGFSRVTTPEIRSNRVNANSGALSLPLPRLAINKIGNRTGIENNFNPTAWMHPAQKNAYENIGQLVSIIQKQSNDSALNMYFDKMQMAGASVRESFSWDKTRIDFVDTDVWGRAEILPIGFYKTDGRNIFEIRGASGGVATAEIFYMVLGTQLFVNNPAATAYIDTLAVPSGY
jgi:hypothetical protein